MFDVQSSPSNSKPDNELFPELMTKAPVSKRAPSSLPKPPGRVSGLPLPPSMRKPKLEPVETVEAAELVEDDEVETIDAREMSDARDEMSDDSETEPLPLAISDEELIEDAPAAAVSPLDALMQSKTKPASSRPILPKYDAELDDGPTIALPSSVVNPPPTSRPPPRSQSVSGPVLARASSALKSAPLPPIPMPPVSAPTASAPTASAPAPRSVSAPPTSARVPTGLLRAGGSAPPPVQAFAPVPAVAVAQPSADSGRLSSIPPVMESLPPPAPKSRSILPWLAAAAAVVLIAGTGIGFAAVKGSALGFGGSSTGSVVVTAAGVGGKAVSGLRVLVDGEEKCSTSPCRIDAARAGTRLITATAPGYESTAARAVSVEAGGESALHIDLTPVAQTETVAEAPKAEAPKAEEKTEAPAAKIETADKADKASSAPAKVSSAKAAPAVAKPAVEEKPAPAAMGTLNINSIPRANVVLDGRPMGMTPVMGVSVTPGNHTVVFVHPEHGRKVAGANVQAGGTATVGVRF